MLRLVSGQKFVVYTFVCIHVCCHFNELNEIFSHIANKLTLVSKLNTRRISPSFSYDYMYLRLGY